MINNWKGYMEKLEKIIILDFFFMLKNKIFS